MAAKSVMEKVRMKVNDTVIYKSLMEIDRSLADDGGNRKFFVVITCFLGFENNISGEILDN